MVKTTATRRKLHELQQFVLHRKSDDIRDELYEYMIMRVIFDYEKTNSGLAYDSILYHIEQDYYLKDLPRIHINKAIERLMLNNHISKRDKILFLSEEKRLEIKNTANEYEQLKNNVIESLKEKLKEGIPSLTITQVDLLVTNFQELLGLTFARYGILTARIFVNGSKNIRSLKGLTGFQETYKKTILNIMPSKIHENLDKIFNDYFFNPTEQLSKFFFTMAQSYVLLEVLNVDPELKKIQKTAWSRKKIYLDTNILIALLFNGSDLHDSIETLVKQTKQLGAKIVVSETTSKEFEKWLSDCRKSQVKIKPNSKMSLIKQIDHEDPFLKTYQLESSQIIGLTTEAFCVKYENYDKFLQTKYSVDMEDDYTESLSEHKDVDRLKSKILDASPRKNDTTAFHDMYHILKVRELRQKSPSDEIGPNVWFLTNDHSLARVEKEIYGDNKIFSSITAEIWMQIISTFISPTMTVPYASTAFTKLLSSNFSSHKVSSDDLDNLMQVFMNEADFTNEQLRAIIGDTFVRERLREIKDLVEEGEELTLDKVKPFISSVEKVLKEDYNKKFTNKEQSHKEELEKIEKQVEELSSKIVNLESQTEKTKKKYLHLKMAIPIIIGSAITNLLFVIGLNSIPNYPPTNIVLYLLGLFAIEAGLVFGLPKIFDYVNERKKNKIKHEWSRIEKITLIGVVIAIIGVIIALLEYMK